MNETLRPQGFPETPWRAGEPPVPDTSMLPGSEKAPPPAVGLLKQAVRGAHQTIDRLADRAAPAVRQLGDSVAAAETALHDKAEQLRAQRDAWTDDARCTVRERPLTCVAVALAVGVLVGRLAR